MYLHIVCCVYIQGYICTYVNIYNIFICIYICCLWSQNELVPSGEHADIYKHACLYYTRICHEYVLQTQIHFFSPRTDTSVASTFINIVIAQTCVSMLQKRQIIYSVSIELEQHLYTYLCYIYIYHISICTPMYIYIYTYEIIDYRPLQTELCTLQPFPQGVRIVYDRLLGFLKARVPTCIVPLLCLYNIHLHNVCTYDIYLYIYIYIHTHYVRFFPPVFYVVVVVRCSCCCCGMHLHIYIYIYVYIYSFSTM